MNSLTKVSIIILNFNGGNYLLNCLESVIKNTFSEIEIILIDNGSTDNSQNICKNKFPKINLIENKTNVGMGGRNIGLEKAKGEYCVFLDSDTLVTEKWLENLIDSFKTHGPGLYQGKLLDLTNKQIINSAGNMINVFGLGFSRGKGNVDDGQFEKFERISYTSGACTFSSTNIMKKIQVDPIFFLYHDDLDFGWRANLLSIPSYYEPSTIVYHYGSPNLKWSSQKFYYLERNRWICIKSLYSNETLKKIFPYVILFEIGMFFFLASKGEMISKIKSIFALRSLQSEIKMKKMKNLKDRKVSDQEIIKNFTYEFHFPNNISSGKLRSFMMRVIENLSKKAISRIKNTEK